VASGPIRFLLGAATGVAVTLALLVVALWTLDGAGALKAPAFTNRATFDEKLRFVRAHPSPAPEWLFVGSSTTLWGVDATTLASRRPPITALNVGIRDLKVHQLAAVTKLYLDLLPSIRTVVVISTPMDFEQCGDATAIFFDPQEAASYLRRDHHELYYQLRNLDILGIVRRAPRIAADRREPAIGVDALAFDRSGSILLDLPPSAVPATVMRGSMPDFADRCYEALGAFARGLRRREGRRLVFVLAPMRPAYLAALDADGALLDAHRRRLAGLAAEERFTFIDAHRGLDLDEAAFFDAYHLRASIVPQVTRYIVEAMNKQSLSIVK